MTLIPSPVACKPVLVIVAYPLTDSAPEASAIEPSLVNVAPAAIPWPAKVTLRPVIVPVAVLWKP